MISLVTDMERPLPLAATDFSAISALCSASSSICCPLRYLFIVMVTTSSCRVTKIKHIVNYRPLYKTSILCRAIAITRRKAVTKLCTYFFSTIFFYISLLFVSKTAWHACILCENDRCQSFTLQNHVYQLISKRYVQPLRAGAWVSWLCWLMYCLRRRALSSRGSHPRSGFWFRCTGVRFSCCWQRIHGHGAVQFLIRSPSLLAKWNDESCSF